MTDHFERPASNRYAGHFEPPASNRHAGHPEPPASNRHTGHPEPPASNRHTGHPEPPANNRNAWEDQHLRTHIIHTVLSRATVDPNSPDLFAGIPELDRLFGGPEGLLLALRYRWNIHLDAKMDQALLQGQSAGDAYLELAAEQPALRAVLDARYRRHNRTSEALAR